MAKKAADNQTDDTKADDNTEFDPMNVVADAVNEAIDNGYDEKDGVITATEAKDDGKDDGGDDKEADDAKPDDDAAKADDATKTEDKEGDKDQEGGADTKADDKDKDAKQAGDGADKGEGKKADPDSGKDTDDAAGDEEIRASLSERARNRFDKLIHDREQVITERDEAVRHGTALSQVMTSAGLDLNELQDLMETARLVKTGNVNDMNMALTRLDAYRGMIARHLGVEAPGFDPIAQFPDLKAGIDSMEITREHALEIAKYRIASNTQQQQTQQQNVRQGQQNALAQEATQAHAEVVRLEDEWTKKDIDYPLKRDRVAEYASALAQQVLQGQIGPIQAKDAIVKYYDDMSAAMNDAAEKVRKATPASKENQPLTKSGRGGEGVQFEAKDIDQAVRHAYDNMP